jgi:AraC family transcriptional regulator, melibiose operon regulatory protein
MQIHKIETEENGRELTNHGSHDFPCGSYDERFSHFFEGEVPWHWHDEIEIVLVLEGATKLESINSNDIVETGEMVFINANTLHRLTNHSVEDCRILNVVFSPKMLGGVGFGLIYKKHVLPVINNKKLLFYKFSSDIGWHKKVINELASAFGVWNEERTDREFYMNIALMKFWHIFCFNQQDILSTDSTSKTNEKRIQTLLNFIHNHYGERISIAEISHSASISETECYRIFRNALGCSPNSYLLNYRLRRSAKLLTESDKKIADIAYESGFNCSAYFAKKFKLTYSLTPFQFRKKYSITVSPLANHLFDQSS